MKKIELYLSNNEYDAFAGMIRKFSEYAEDNGQDFLKHYSDQERTEVLNACGGIPYYVRLGIRLQMDAMKRCIGDDVSGKAGTEENGAVSGGTKSAESSPDAQGTSPESTQDGRGEVIQPTVITSYRPSMDAKDGEAPADGTEEPVQENIRTSGYIDVIEDSADPGTDSDSTYPGPKYSVEDVRQEGSGDFDIG